MLDFSGCTRTGISILILAADMRYDYMFNHILEDCFEYIAHPNMLAATQFIVISTLHY